MNAKQIGVLLPTSTIFPISKDFDKGIKDGLGNFLPETTIIREFIGQGNIKQAEDAINKLIGFDEADIITGIVSAKVTEQLAPKFLSGKVPFLVSELGEYIPNPAKLNNYVFVNSQHMWQHAWAMGNWGVKNIGIKGMFIGSVYDTAYSFSHMFYEGMMAADPQALWSFSVPPNPPPGALSDMSVIFPFLEKYQPDFVFAAFCGTEATLFLNEFISKGWHKKTRLMGLPFLLSPFAPLLDDITVYTTLPDTAIPAMTASESFYGLGFRAGTIIAESLAAENIYDGLLSNHKTVPLGSTHYMIPAGNNAEIISIVENHITAAETHIRQSVIDTTPTFSLRDERLPEFINDINAGWLNPYLCI